MDNAEAEAVLLVPLEWSDGFLRGAWNTIAFGREYAYSVTEVRLWSWRLWYSVDTVSRVRLQRALYGKVRRYKYAADAKAACERHRATGKWE